MTLLIDHQNICNHTDYLMKRAGATSWHIETMDGHPVSLDDLGTWDFGRLILENDDGLRVVQTIQKIGSVGDVCVEARAIRRAL